MPTKQSMWRQNGLPRRLRLLAMTSWVIAVAFSPILAKAKDDILVNCSFTPNIAAPEHFPGEKNISSTNNLRRATGAPEIAAGKPIRLIGRVVDENCVPIADAKVIIWHANSFGYYNDDAEKIDEVNDEKFLGSGQYYTNNLGQYEFISIKPGSIGWKAPQINIKVTKPGFDEVNTTIYFEDEPKTDFDPVYSKLSPEKQKSLIARKRLLEDSKVTEVSYYFDVTMRGMNKNVGY